jgi:hypothetical protein
MNEKPIAKTGNVRDTEQLLRDIQTLLARIKFLRAKIALYLLLTEDSPQRGESSDR